VLGAVREQQPRVLILLGVCLDPYFRLEMVARNHWSFENDIDHRGSPPSRGPHLVEEAPDYYFSTLPFERLREGLGGSVAGIPVEISTDAGGFICNQVYYLALHHLGNVIPRIGFIHTPPLGSEFVETPWSDEQIVNAGITLLTELTAELRKSEALGHERFDAGPVT
jgi:pyroglutamyl-peptidase